MEGEMETEMIHINRHRRHPLILKEIHHADGHFECFFCRKDILCKTSSVYTCQVQEDDDCASFFLHKKCADLPVTFTHPNHTHSLQFIYIGWRDVHCSVCQNYILYGYYHCDVCDFEMCLRCSVTPATTIQHWSHKHRQLRFVDRCSTFKCDACNTVATDSSYRCDDTTCPFWIHQSCATLPQTKLFRIHHKHPLKLSDSLPQIYRGFSQFCKICNKELDFSEWLYYCANCRFFAHISCALSTTPVSRGGLDDPKLMHLPPSDEQSNNLMMQKCIKDMVSLSMDITEVPPDHINHPAHEQHPLALNTKRVATYDGINQEPERLIICDCCVKPIFPSLDDSEVFYECSKCNFFLHSYCALFPNEVHHQLLGMLKGRFVIRGDIRRCHSCKYYSNGLMFESKYAVLDVCCACRPEKIMHIGHHHALKQQYRGTEMRKCKACCCNIYEDDIMFGCETCEFSLHQRCALKPATLKHRWDPHPLHLILSLEDQVEDHPHDFECEFCSNVIDTNGWFYHCSICDLSFHVFCVDPYSNYSNVKFGATGIKIKAHDHDLTLVQNKEKRRACGSCRRDTKGHAILECKPCNFTVHSPDKCCRAIYCDCLWPY